MRSNVLIVRMGTIRKNGIRMFAQASERIFEYSVNKLPNFFTFFFSIQPVMAYTYKDLVLCISNFIDILDTLTVSQSLAFHTKCANYTRVRVLLKNIIHLNIRTYNRIFENSTIRYHT